MHDALVHFTDKEAGAKLRIGLASLALAVGPHPSDLKLVIGVFVLIMLGVPMLAGFRHRLI